MKVVMEDERKKLVSMDWSSVDDCWGGDVGARLEESVERYFRDKGLYDGRGKKADEKEKVGSLLRQVRQIFRCYEDESRDQNLRHDCRSFLRRVARGGSGGALADLFKPATELVGRQQRDGRRRNDREQRCSPMEHDLGDCWWLRRITSVKGLKDEGLRYQNCLRTNEYRHHTKLKCGRSAFFVFGYKRGGRGRGWVIEVDLVEDRIVHVEGAEREDLVKLAGGDLKLRAKLLSALKLIGARSDEAFGAAGAYTEFLEDFALGSPDALSSLGYSAWAKEDVLILRRRLRGRLAQWSRFVLDGECWCADYGSALDEGDLACLFAPRWPGLGKLVRGASRSRATPKTTNRRGARRRVRPRIRR